MQMTMSVENAQWGSTSLNFSKLNVSTAHQTPALWKAIFLARLEQPVPLNALTDAWLKKVKLNCAIKMPTVCSSFQIPSLVPASLVTKAMALDPIAALTNAKGSVGMMGHACITNKQVNHSVNALDRSLE